ncbi:ATP-dependent DNA helicase PIF1-like [Helianthus annuus]|uniref:ATP-dependent DNA helicase PIF1-like n=1 Tax=Helianthus annuus TaxID=4232 RepID=UPI000B8FCD2B|nr:ATP-dependent DNA helicase PIF1-like [Helianthus annuus]
MAAVASRKGGLFFVYGYGGTGKTFLWKTLASAVRCRGEIVLNVASSGIASLLLPRGRTAHSCFHIPINLTEDSMCHIKPNSDIAILLKETQLIIWDEAPMVHKHAFEALDRTMSDVFSDGRGIRSDVPFGGKVFVFGGDFRQILPVIPNGTRQQIVCASLSSSYIWSKCKLLRLTKNMRLTIGADSSDMDSIRDFAKWLLDIGEGKLGDDNDGEAIIQIPGDLLITDNYDPIQSLIDFVYPSIMEQFWNPGDAKELVLKVGVHVMLLRNIDQQKGLCNGTRLKITFLGKRVIEAEVISGGNIGTRVFIPRLNMIPSDKKIPFKFQRRQFPLSVCFAMTINKSQGQSLSKVGLYLKDPVFTHGQLYVALSRVKTREGVKILIFDADEKPTNKTSNVVYKEVFGSL